MWEYVSLITTSQHIRLDIEIAFQFRRMAHENTLHEKAAAATTADVTQMNLFNEIRLFKWHLEQTHLFILGRLFNAVRGARAQLYSNRSSLSMRSIETAASK